MALAVVASRGATAEAKVRLYFVSAGNHDDKAVARTRSELARAASSTGVGAIEDVEIASATAPRARSELQQATQAMAELRYGDAVGALSAAIAEVAITGGAGLDAAELDDLFLLRGAAALHLGDAARASAWDDFVKAALLAPERVLDPGRFPPAVMATWTRAVAEAHRRPRGVLVVRAGPGARVAVDDRPPAGAPAVIAGLTYGEHYIRVEEVGRAPWSTLAVLAAATVDVDVPPRALLSLDDRGAAERARRAGADFAIVATPSAGASAEPLLDLALVRASDAVRVDAALVRVDSTNDAVTHALARLAAQTTPPSPVAASTASDDTGRRRRWPYYVAGLAVAAVAGTVIAIVASSGSSSNGFSVGLNPGQLTK